MLNTSEWHSADGECVLSQTTTDILQQMSFLNATEKPIHPIEAKLSWILEQNPDKKYYLSAAACKGILTRAERRGKKLPEILRTALENMIVWQSDATYST